MKRNFIFAISLILISFTGCSKASKAPADTTGSAEGAMSDSLRQAEEARRADSIAVADFISKDLKTFWLHGHVKEVEEITESGYKVTIKFDRNGMMTYHSAFATKKSNILRDADDHIISMVNEGAWDGRNEGQDYSYDADGYPMRLSHWAEAHDTYQYTRSNKQGWPLEATLADTEDDFSGKVTFEYPDVDAYGNWTRQVSYETWPDIEKTTYTTTRSITYYR